MREDDKIQEFSLFGGPLQRLGCRLGLVRGGTNTIRLGLSLGLLAWGVLIVLGLLQGLGHKMFSLALIGGHVRLKFLDRLRHVLSETSTSCYAWAIIFMKHTGRNWWRRPIRLLNCEQPQFPCLYPRNHYQPPPLLFAHAYVPHSPDHPRGPLSLFPQVRGHSNRVIKGTLSESRDTATIPA